MATARLLIVDDEPDALKTISRMLSHGYDVFTYSSPRAALELVKTKPGIDLVLSDTEMDEMRGTDLIREIRQIVPLMPCMLMSVDEAAVSELPPGAQFLLKPFTTEELIAKVESVLYESRTLRADLRETVKKSQLLREQVRRDKDDLLEIMLKTERARKDFGKIFGQSSQVANTIICASCTAELPIETSLCTSCREPVGLHTIVHDRSKFGIAVNGHTKIHGLTFARAKQLVEILNSV